MITCPECGLEASDDAKFCDRCGQGLSKAAASASQSPAPRPEDPNGPSAKTAELRPAVAQTNGTASPPQMHASSSQVGESAIANASGEGLQSAVEIDAGASPASIVMAEAAENSSTDEATEGSIATIATEAQPNPNPEPDNAAHEAAPG